METNREMKAVVRRLIEGAGLPTKNPTRLIGELKKRAKRDGLSNEDIAHLGSVLRHENAKKLRLAKRKPALDESQDA